MTTCTTTTPTTAETVGPPGFRARRGSQAVGLDTTSIRAITALPIDPTPRDDPLDPERILRELPERERETFLTQYRRAVDEAHDPAGWKHLRRFLRLRAMRAIAVAQPGYYDARNHARAGTGGGMPLEDALRQHRPRG